MWGSPLSNSRKVCMTYWSYFQFLDISEKKTFTGFSIDVDVKSEMRTDDWEKKGKPSNIWKLNPLHNTNILNDLSGYGTILALWCSWHSGRVEEKGKCEKNSWECILHFSFNLTQSHRQRDFVKLENPQGCNKLFISLNSNMKSCVSQWISCFISWGFNFWCYSFGTSSLIWNVKWRWTWPGH